MEEEKIIYIYTCENCHKFKEEPRRNDNLVCCNSTMRMAKPEETIKHYKKTRLVYNLLTILFTIILPVLTVVLFMFTGKESSTETTTTLGYKLPILTFIIIGAILLKGRKLLDKLANKLSNQIARGTIIFFSRNVMYLVLIGIVSPILIYLLKVPEQMDSILEWVEGITNSLQQILWALGLVVLENTLGYCLFNYKAEHADYLIKRAVRQTETIQAMEMSGR